MYLWFFFLILFENKTLAILRKKIFCWQKNNETYVIIGELKANAWPDSTSWTDSMAF